MALPGRKAEYPWRGRHRSCAGRSSQVPRPGSDRPDTRTMPNAGRPGPAPEPAGTVQQRDPSNDCARRLAVRVRKPARVQRRSYLVFEAPAGDQCSAPEGSRGPAVPGQQPGLRDGRIEIDHRSRRLSSRSARTSSRLATGAGLGGAPDPASAGGASTPDRTASVRKASAGTGLRLSRNGPNSATTRSRSVTSMVSPEAASRTYSLKRLFSALIPIDLMRQK